MNVTQPGAIVAGRYRIEGELGQGGMGAVYRATHIELSRPVALKMVRPDLLDLDTGLARFKREAELAQKLEHPNTVRLYDYGQTETGLPYIAFELLRGTPLDRAIYEGGPMPPPRVARIIIQVLKSLMEAHGQGIIHRDIKPANVFLCEFSGEQDFVKVLDFGIAKSQNARTLVTRAGLSPGTPNYMAPEMVRGESLTPAADIYAVGLMMAEMLTAQMVFSGTPTDIVTEHISPQPVPLPQSLMGSPLWPVLVRATEKDLSRRYSYAGEMLRDLEEIVRAGALEPFRAGQPLEVRTAHVTFRPPSPTPDAATVLAQPRPVKRSSPLPMILVLAALCAIGGGVAIYLSTGSSSSSKGPTVDNDDDAPKKKPLPKQDKDDDDNDNLNPADTKSIKKRFQKLGWKITSESTTKQPTLTVYTYVGQKGAQIATLYVYDTDDESVAKGLETSLNSKGSATKRVGTKLYWVMTIPADGSLADDLVWDLAR